MRQARKKRDEKRRYVLNTRQLVQAVKRNGVQFTLWFAGISFFLFLTVNVHSFILSAPYFNVSEVEIIGNSAGKIDYPLARLQSNPNIFTIDLKKVEESIEREYVYIQKAIVKRILPNKLLIEVVRRSPIAQIAVNINKGNNPLQHFFSINEEGYILDDFAENPHKKLPVVYGSGIGYDRIQVGYCYRGTNLQYAISFLEELRNNDFLNHYSVSQIDITSLQNMSFIVDEKVEVKIGSRNWKKKLETLCGILQKMNKNYSQDYYIDLRFKDVIFGKKGDKPR